MDNVKIILEEILLAEKYREIKMLPIVEIYQAADQRAILNYARDYIWFNEEYDNRR